MLQPLVTIKVVALALKMGWRSDRGCSGTSAYLTEAAVLAVWCRRDGVQHLTLILARTLQRLPCLRGDYQTLGIVLPRTAPRNSKRAPLLSLDLKLANAAFAVCVSSFGRAQLMRWSPADLWDKIVLVHCGVDNSFLDFNGPISSAPQFGQSAA